MSQTGQTAKPAFDADAYRAQLRGTWDGLGPAWERWQDLFERGAASVTSWLMDSARVSAGDRVLDVATGTGEPALTVAGVVGGGGRVVGIDLAPAMVEVARRRGAGLAQVEFAVEDVETLSYPAGSFDVVLSRFGLMLVADKERAFARIADVLAPGGRLAFATWTAPGRVPIVSLAFGVAAGMLELPPPPPGLPGPFSMADPEAVRPLLEAAGFGDVTATELTATFTADSVTEFVEYACGTLPPWLLGRLRERFGADLAEVKEAVAGATAAYTGDDGTVLMPSVALGVSAVRR